MFGLSRYSTVGLIGLFVFMGVAAHAQASPTNDIADGLNDALFDGSNLYAAETILTGAVMASVGILLAAIGSGGGQALPKEAIFIVLFCVLGALTAIGWADIMFILVAGLVGLTAFVSKVAGIWTD